MLLTVHERDQFADVVRHIGLLRVGAWVPSNGHHDLTLSRHRKGYLVGTIGAVSVVSNRPDRAPDKSLKTTLLHDMTQHRLGSPLAISSECKALAFGELGDGNHYR